MNDKWELREATIDAEEALLGCLLVAVTDLIKPVSELVSVQDFYGCYPGRDLPRTARIYRAMLACEQTDQISVARALVQQDSLQQYDIAYMSHLVSICPCALDGEYYAQMVRDYSMARQIEYYTRMGNWEKVRWLASRGRSLKRKPNDTQKAIEVEI